MKKCMCAVLLILLAVFVSGCMKLSKTRDTDVTKTEVSDTDIAKKKTVRRKVVLYAEYPYYENAEELVESADLIFSGIIKKIRYELVDTRDSIGSDIGKDGDDSIPYTIYDISIDKVYKGIYSEKTISVKILGGKTNDSLYILADAVNLKSGGSYLFLTKTYDSSYSSFLNANQAAYSMEKKNGRTLKQAGDKADHNIKLEDIMKIINK